MAIAALLIPAILETAGRVLDKLIPDPEARAKAQLELLRAQQEMDLKQLDADVQLALKQLDVNLVEASSPDAWASGWRPAAGWAGVAGMAYTALLQPLLAWGSAVKGWPLPPNIGSEELWAVLFGLLGLGAYRSVEKVKGVTR